VRGLNDEQTIKKFFDRDESALSDARLAYGDYCRSVANGILKDSRDSEECVNDTFFAAWNSIPPDRPENLKAYLGKLTRNGALDILRKNNAEKRIPSAALVPFDELEEATGEAMVEDQLTVSELSRIISDFLHSQKETERKVFIRRYWYCDSISDICARYGYGKSKVLMMLKRTRDKLAESLKKEGYTYEK
jgi:RNA polymerase sigma-70 factor (ECF subfamily)